MDSLLAALVYLNNYMHDLATAVFLVTTLMAWWIRKERDHLPDRLFPNLGRMAAISFVLILLLGAVRTVNYRAYEWLPALDRAQVHILIGKHVILVGLTFWAAWAWWSMAKRNPG